MCFLALLSKVVPDYPVVVAANRDESPARPGTPPRQIRAHVFAGVDPRAGGTWLGVSAARRVVGITNLRSNASANPAARSRGLLCLDMLTAPADANLVALLGENLGQYAYNPFNLIIADAEGAFVATFDRRLCIRDLDPGIHIIGNTLPDDEHDPKVIRGRVLIRNAIDAPVSRAEARSAPGDIDRTLEMLTEVCRDHGQRSDHADTICAHGEGSATLASSIIAIHETDLKLNRYLHAQGLPCRTAYQDFSHGIRLDT